MGTWDNDDGLRIRYGQEEVDANLGGFVNTEGPYRYAEFTLDWTDLNSVAVGTNRFLSETVKLPKDAVLEDVELFVQDTFTSGGSATLTLGMVASDRTTAIDADGIDTAIAVASLTGGTTIANNGALVGTKLAAEGYLVANTGTAAWTAGKAKLRIKYYNDGGTS